jgi:hypothetical protein
MRRRFPNRPNRSRLARAGLLVCAIALGSIAVACGSDEPGAPEPAATPADPTQLMTEPAPPAAATPGPADESNPEAVLAEGVIPEGFPSDVPVYPGAEIGPSMTTPGLGVFATFGTGDAVEPILTYYRTELAKNGWSVVDTPAGDGIDGTKGGRALQVRARRDEESRTEIAINATGS